MDAHIDSLYICVKDMKRAIKFYEKFFEQSVTERDDIYSVFVIHGFRFGLFAYEKVNEEHTFGTNCVPSVCVESLSALREKLKMYGAAFPITKIGSNWVGEINDSEGNRIELTTPCESLLVLVRYILAEGKRDEFLREFEKAGIAEASKKEEGNLRYDIFLPADSENDVCLTEVWENAEAQVLHGKTPHYKKLAKLKKAFVRDAIIEKHRLHEFK